MSKSGRDFAVEKHFIFTLNFMKTHTYSQMLCSTLAVLILLSNSVSCFEWKYHTNTELENYLHDFTKIKSDVKSRLYSIGKSVNKSDLWVVEITAVDDGKIAVPNIKLIGTIHGNEPVGREILLYFMEYLRDNYKNNTEVKWLLDNARIHILPNLNPDGFDISFENMCVSEHGRCNKHNKDLNRNFPDFYHKNLIPETHETKAVRKWLDETPFVLSAAFHGGALVTNYPFDTIKQKVSLEKPQSLTPDNDVFVHLATVYAQNHLTMHKGTICEYDKDKRKFEGGIINGAAWYSFAGGMQDYNYAYHGVMELTMEISCCKYPPANQLPQFWEENKVAILKYCLEGLKGISGQIIDNSTGNPIAKAELKVSGRNMTFFSSKKGEFWRILLPGKYNLEVSADGYYQQIVPFTVQNSTNSTFLRIHLLNSSISTTTTQRSTTEHIKRGSTLSNLKLPPAVIPTQVVIVGRSKEESMQSSSTTLSNLKSSPTMDTDDIQVQAIVDRNGNKSAVQNRIIIYIFIIFLLYC